MKHFLPLLLILWTTPCFSQEKQIWIVAPGITIENSEKKAALEKKLLEVFKQNHRENFKATLLLNTAQGFALSYYLQLDKDASIITWPDYVVYYQPARFLSFDLKEMLSSDLDDYLKFSKMDKDAYKAQPLTPSFLEHLLPDASQDALKKSLFYNRRLQEVKSLFPEPDTEDQMLEMSIWPLQELNRLFVTKSGNKTKFILFLSPERIRYTRDILAGNGWADFAGRLMWGDVSISRQKVKEYFRSAPFTTFMLPKRFGDLQQQEYLKADSTVELNSTGTQKWTENIGAAIADANSPVK
jgi:hypothetical protein